MTIELKNVKGSLKDMDNLFENAEKVSVRYYCPSKKNSENFDITIRCNEDVAPTIQRKRTLKGILKTLGVK